MNEYQEKFEELRSKHTFKGQQWLGGRKELVEEYSWAVPSSEVLSYLAHFDEIVDMGAGKGYWSHLLEERGVDVSAYDIDPPDETWTDVEECCISSHGGWTEDVIKEICEAPTMTVWPPLGGPVARRIAAIGPPHILYVGESRGGCTASDEFFDQLDKKYGLVGKVDIPSYTGVNDNFYHYIRKV